MMKRISVLLLGCVLLAGGMNSCETIKNFGAFLGFEEKLRVEATVEMAAWPVFHEYQGRGAEDGRNSSVSAAGSYWSQQITVRCQESGEQLSGSIKLNRERDRLNTGDSGYVLIGKRSGSVRGFEKR